MLFLVSFGWLVDVFVSMFYYSETTEGLDREPTIYIQF